MTVVEILPDDAALRQARRARVLAAMEAADIDFLVVGREGNARYVSGAPRLWTAGSRAFGPGCVFVRATGAVHLLSTWDEGIPEEIPHENLYGITFNAMNFVKVLEDRRARPRRSGWPPTPCPARRPTCCPRRSRRPSSSTASRCCARSAGSRAPRRSRPSGRRCASPRRRWPRPRTRWRPA